MFIYVVKGGDSLWQIAGRYQVPIARLTEINGLENTNQLTVGQALIIPSLDFFHTLQPGEALWSIAQRYGTTVDAIVRANGISNPALLYPGTVLRIPAPRHTVMPGENLLQIAERYGVTAQSIISANRLQDPSRLYPGTILKIPRPKPTIESNAFTYHSDEKAIEYVGETAELLTYIAPFAYVIQPDGSLLLYMKDDTEAIQTGLAKGALPMMSITNFTATEAGENIAHEVLASREHRSRLLKNILSVLRKKGYRGLNIDFENVLPTDRKLYNAFLKECADALHKEGYFISTSLAPKTSADQKGLLVEAHDYPEHGKIADFVVLMTYEWGYRYGPPRAVSPLNEIRKVLDYAITSIPRNKILMGFQLYARDWLIPHVDGQEAETYSPQEAVNIAMKYGAAIQYDKLSASPFFRYTDDKGRGHEVWFEDARSAQAKFDLIKQYKLRGVSYWILGYPFPQNWVLLEDNFNIKKHM